MTRCVEDTEVYINRDTEKFSLTACRFLCDSLRDDKEWGVKVSLLRM